MSSRTTRRDLLSALGLELAARASAAPATRVRPNILFIYTDDHSYRTLSCYKEAYPWVRTPNIVKLAEQGCGLRLPTTARGACRHARPC